MNKKLNLVEILKDCPKGTKLYSPLFGDVYFQKISHSNAISFSIIVKTATGDRSFYPDGKFLYGYEGAEYLLFPSKENRDWSTFKVPVKRFKLSKFQPFDKVLCRDLNTSVWHCNFFSDIVYPVDCAPYVYTTGLITHYHCIPFNDETKHLVGSRVDCPDYYKWWEE